MSKKLYPEENIQAIANAIRAKNGSSDTYTTSAMAEAITDISSGASILNGTTDPLTAQGENGQLYFKYGDDPDYVYDEILGGYILKDYLASYSGELLCTGEGRTFTKTYDGSAIAVTWYSGVYYGPILISTVADNIAYSNNTVPLGSTEFDGVTWYITTTNYWLTSLTEAYKPRLNTDFAPDANTVRQAIEAVLEASGFTSSINNDDVIGAFAKVNGTWQNLIGTDIEDIIDTVAYNSNLMIGEFVTSDEDHGIVNVNVGFKPDLLVVELPFGLGVDDTTIATWEKHANWAQTRSVWAIPSEAKTVYTLLDRVDGEAGIQAIKNTGFSFMSHALNTRNKTCKYVAVKYVGSTPEADVPIDMNNISVFREGSMFALSDDDTVIISCNGNNIGFTAFYSTPIDATDISKLKYELKTRDCYGGGAQAQSPNWYVQIGLMANAPATFVNAEYSQAGFAAGNYFANSNTDYGTQEIDVSSLSGDYYFVINAHGWNASIKNLRSE